MDRLHENRIYTGTVESYSSEGLGIVRLDGAVVFVPQAVRGETIDLKITKVMKTAAAGEIVKIHKPSPDRAQPECPDYGRCGGCDFQHLTYPEELWAKRQRVQDALTRLGGADIRVEEILGAKNPLHYRNKSQYPVGADGAIGFYRARSHQVVPVKRCLIQPEAADKTAAAVGEWMRRYKVPAYDEATGKGLVRHVYVRVNRKGESLCCVVINGRQAPREPELAAYVCATVPHTAGVLVNSNTKRGNVILGERYRTLWGRDYLMDTLCGLEFKLSVPSFYQVNRDQAEILYGKALDYAGLTGRETVLDLYCGIGTITLCLAKRAGRVIGAEIVPPAIEDAWENARKNGVTNVEFICADAVLRLAQNVTDGLHVNEKIVERTVREYLPFMTSENLMMEAVKRGGNRQELHEIIRSCSMEATARMKNGESCNLLELLSARKEFGMTPEEIEALLDPRLYVGRCPEQVTRFLAEVNPLLADVKRTTAEINL